MTSTHRVLLLRHGQSEWNALSRWQGTADSPLSELGRQQARFVGSVLAASTHGFEAVWASDLSRAAETASIVGAALGLGPVQIEPRLREAHVGEWEGMTSEQISAAWPGFLEAQRRPPGFEPFDAVVDRVVPAVLAISASAPTVLAVAHSGVIRTLVRHLGEADTRIANLGGVWLTVADDGLRVDGSFDPTGEAGYQLDLPGENPVAGH